MGLLRNWILALSLLVSLPDALAAVPTTIHYQGYLTNAAGVPENSTLAMTFSLYEGENDATARWTETHPAVTVSHGHFAVELGSINSFENGLNPPFSIDTRPVLYLGISVGQDAEMVPRLHLSSVPYARRAEKLVECANGETNCNGKCVVIGVPDDENCGACGNKCEHAGDCRTWGIDLDGDGIPGSTTGMVCTPPPGASEYAGAGDCNDHDPAVGVAQVYYFDGDGDGWGDPRMPSPLTCVRTGVPYPYNRDCDDTSNAVNPDHAEVCGNGIDDNCDGRIDEGC